jgi:hypothetical protein
MPPAFQLRALALTYFATMPGHGIFRVMEVCVDERPINAGAEHVRSRNYPA